MRFSKNVPNALQDMVLTMFPDAHTDARTYGQDKTVCLRPHYVGRRHNNS